MHSAPPTKPDARTPADARLLADAMLADAIARWASDVHLEPHADGYDLRLRIDGQLQPAARYDTQTGRSLVLRLMVMAQLLTYRLDIPQEGRLHAASAPNAPSSPGAPNSARASNAAAEQPLECRLAIMPTIHGLRAAVRIPATEATPRDLESLELPASVLEGIRSFAAGDDGMLIVTGPAGSGKTTTNYALLSEIVRQSPGLSVVALEDPVERDLSGVTQIEVNSFGQLTYERALRSIVRQDPQVLMLGEIRDEPTAALAMQAALSGHRLVCTLHAARPGGAIARLLEMGIEPYQLTSAIRGIVAQRLLRRRAPADDDHPDAYRGRVPAAEFAAMTPPLRAGILRRDDAQALQHIIESQQGYITMRGTAEELANRGVTDRNEIDRVFGG